MYKAIPKNKITKIAIVKTDCKKTLKQVVSEQKCNYAINGGLYDMKTGAVNPIPLRINGRNIAKSNDGYWMFAWNTGRDFCMIHSKDIAKWKNAVACSTMLKDGANTIFNYTSQQGGVRGRTAIGDDESNIYLWVTTDKSGALSPTSLRTKMRDIGAKNAIMLDSGGSSQMYCDGTYVYSEARKVAYWICIWVEKAPASNQYPGNVNETCPYSEPRITVKAGYVGNNARWVQWMLNATMSAKLTVDGAFGTKTVVALRVFQSKYGLASDGICGPLTKEKLKEIYNERKTQS